MYTVGDTFVYTPIRESRFAGRTAEPVTAHRPERRPERKPEFTPERKPEVKQEFRQERRPEREERVESSRLDRLEEAVYRLEKTVAYLSELVERRGSPVERPPEMPVHMPVESPRVSPTTGEQSEGVKVSVFAGESASASVGQVRVIQQ